MHTICYLRNQTRGRHVTIERKAMIKTFLSHVGREGSSVSRQSRHSDSHVLINFEYLVTNEHEHHLKRGNETRKWRSEIAHYSYNDCVSADDYSHSLYKQTNSTIHFIALQCNSLGGTETWKEEGGAREEFKGDGKEESTFC